MLATGRFPTRFSITLRASQTRASRKFPLIAVYIKKPIPRSNSNIKVSKQDSGGLRLGGSIFRIINSIPSIFQTFTTSLFKGEHFCLTKGKRTRHSDYYYQGNYFFGCFW